MTLAVIKRDHVGSDVLPVHDFAGLLRYAYKRGFKSMSCSVPLNKDRLLKVSFHSITYSILSSSRSASRVRSPCPRQDSWKRTECTRNTKGGKAIHRWCMFMVETTRVGAYDGVAVMVRGERCSH
jgi:hypothetical protein